ncbi:MAG: hypothetical protein F6K08_31000 [Okeania sp. SIO1H6]|nr:hypothetical protein [Okeania sp. SIO1H6]
MLLKSQTIINQEELVSILEAQLKKAKSRLTELTKADAKIESVVSELESLLNEHPDYKLVVSDRLKLQESESAEPVRIEIEQEFDRLDEFTEILDSASNLKLKFARIENTVAVGIYGKKIFGKYGITDSEIWMDKSLSDYLFTEHGIKIDDILSQNNSEIKIEDHQTIAEATKYTKDEIEAYDSLFGEAPPESDRNGISTSSSQKSDDTSYLKEIGNNTLKGVAPSPKLQSCSESGNKPDSKVSEPSVVQTELDLELEDEPGQIEATTPLLEAVKAELEKVNNTLEYCICKYGDKGSTFLEIYHGDSHIGYFEDDGTDCLWESCKNLLHHGFTQEQLEAISEIEIPKG